MKKYYYQVNDQMTKQIMQISNLIDDKKQWKIEKILNKINDKKNIWYKIK